MPESFADRQILPDRITGGQPSPLSTIQPPNAQKSNGGAKEQVILAAPEGAATLAALIILRQTGWIQPDERVVLFNTGTGLGSPFDHVRWATKRRLGDLPNRLLVDYELDLVSIRKV